MRQLDGDPWPDYPPSDRAADRCQATRRRASADAGAVTPARLPPVARCGSGVPVGLADGPQHSQSMTRERELTCWQQALRCRLESPLEVNQHSLISVAAAAWRRGAVRTWGLGSSRPVLLSTPGHPLSILIGAIATAQAAPTVESVSVFATGSAVGATRRSDGARGLGLAS